MAGQAEITELISQVAFEQMNNLEKTVGNAVKLFAALNEEAMKFDRAMGGAKTLSGFAETMKGAADSSSKLRGVQEDLIGQNKKLAETQKSYQTILESIAKGNLNVALGNSEVMKSYVEMKQAITKLKEEEKNLVAQLKEKKITQDEYTASAAKLVKEQEAMKANASALAQVIKTETKENMALKGSMDEKAQRLGKLKDLYRQLSEEERNNVSIGGTLLKSIQQQDAELKHLDSTLGNFQRNVGNYKSGMEGFSGQMKNLAGTVTDLAGAYLGFMGLQSVGSFIEGSVEEFMQADKAAHQLQTTLDNLGMSSSFDRFARKGEAVQKAFEWIDNDDVNRALDKLLTYGKLTEDQMDQLLPVIVDFAAKTGQSVPDATEVMIKALEGSGKELKTFGVHVEASNSATENLGILMTELKPKVEGAAKAFSESMAGALASTKQQINDLKEQIGSDLQPTIRTSLESLEGLLMGLKSIWAGGKELLTFIVNGMHDAFTGGQWGMQKAIDEIHEKEKAAFAERADGEAKAMTDLIQRANQLKTMYFEDEKNAKNKKAWGQAEMDIVAKIHAAKAAYGQALIADHKESTAQSQQEVKYYKYLYDALVKINDERVKIFRPDKKTTTSTGGTGKSSTSKEASFGMKPTDWLGQDASMDEQFRKEQDAALAERLAAAQKAFSREQLLAKEAYMSELELAGDNEQKRAEAKENSSKNMIQIEIRYQEEVIRILKAAGADTTEAEKKILDLKAALLDMDAKQHAKTEEEKTKKTKEESEKRQKVQEEIQRRMIEVSDALQNTISAAVNGRYDEEKNRIQDNIDSIEKRKAAEIAAVNASARSAQDKAAEVTLINARAQTQREQLERRQRQIDQERARFERAMAIARIVQNTAVAIAADISTPWKIALDVALGAMAMAQVLSKPIPRFATGREGGPATLAIVGDGGRAEVIESPSGQMTVTPSTPTLTFLPEDYKVHPSIDDAMHSVLESGMAVPVMTSDAAKNAAMMSKLADLYEEETNRLIEAIHSRPEHVQTLTKEGLRELRRRGKGWDEYLAKNLYS